MTREDKFLSVIDANKGILYKVAKLYCKDEEGRKDLIQEIMIQLWQSFDHYNGQVKHSTWMYRIALNTAISFYRKDTRRRPIALPIVDDNLLDIEDIEDNDVEASIQLLYQFLAKIPEVDRALMLLYLEEKSHQQIAEIMGMSLSNVATKISRIKERLKLKFSTTNNQ